MKALVAFGGIALLALAQTPQVQILGHEPCLPCDGGIRLRWPVKTLTDHDWREVKLDAIQETTVTWLIDQWKRCQAGEMASAAARDRRIAPIERQVFWVTGHLRRFGPANDRDVHLDIADPANPDAWMFVEVIDPECYRQCASKDPESAATIEKLHRRLIEARRRLLQAKFFSPAIAFHPAVQGVTMTVTGVGFCDPGYSNVVELHPVLDLEIRER